MSVQYIVGVPGSGKTYYAVNFIYKSFISALKDEKNSTFDKWQRCYTNINEFKFDRFKNVLPLDFDDIFKRIQVLHNAYKKKRTDKKLVSIADRLKISHTLFVIDEAHNFFDVKNPVLVWWLSYHRHLYQEIILITQNLQLIESKYKSFSEYFYKALPTQYRFFGSVFRYYHHTTAKMYQNDRAGILSIKFNKDVYDLYHSGQNTQGKSVFKKYIIYVLIFFVLSVSSFYYLFSSFGSMSKPVSVPMKSNDINTSAKSVKDKNNPFLLEDGVFRLFRVTCGDSYCFNNDLYIPFKVFSQLITFYDLKLLSFEPISIQNFRDYYYLAPERFFIEILNDSKDDKKVSVLGSDNG